MFIVAKFSFYLAQIFELDKLSIFSEVESYLRSMRAAGIFRCQYL